MKVIIAGRRTIDEQTFVEVALSLVPFEITAVLSGECRGVDLAGREWAEKNNIPVIPFPADWNNLGICGGPDSESANGRRGGSPCLDMGREKPRFFRRLSTGKKGRTPHFSGYFA